MLMLSLISPKELGKTTPSCVGFGFDTQQYLPYTSSHENQVLIVEPNMVIARQDAAIAALSRKQGKERGIGSTLSLEGGYNQNEACQF